MQKIELNKIKSSSLWRWRYAVIFTVYTFAFLLVFISVSKFLAKEINRSFGQPSPETENIATTLDLSGYQRLAGRLGLASSTPEMAATSTEADIATATPPLPDTIATTTATASSSQLAAIIQPERRLAILIANSTKKSGLAGKLKNAFPKDFKADFKTGNQPPPLKQTVIRYKESVAPEKLEVIKRIVASQYDPLTEIAAPDAPYDLEIVIGQK
jgi:hypothetical protein